MSIVPSLLIALQSCNVLLLCLISFFEGLAPGLLGFAQNSMFRPGNILLNSSWIANIFLLLLMTIFILIF